MEFAPCAVIPKTRQLAVGVLEGLLQHPPLRNTTTRLLRRVGAMDQVDHRKILGALPETIQSSNMTLVNMLLLHRNLATFPLSLTQQCNVVRAAVVSEVMELHSLTDSEVAALWVIAGSVAPDHRSWIMEHHDLKSSFGAASPVATARIVDALCSEEEVIDLFDHHVAAEKLNESLKIRRLPSAARELVLRSALGMYGVSSEWGNHIRIEELSKSTGTMGPTVNWLSTRIDRLLKHAMPAAPETLKAMLVRDVAGLAIDENVDSSWASLCDGMRGNGGTDIMEEAGQLALKVLTDGRSIERPAVVGNVMGLLQHSPDHFEAVMRTLEEAVIANGRELPHTWQPRDAIRVVAAASPSAKATSPVFCSLLEQNMASSMGSSWSPHSLMSLAEIKASASVGWELPDPWDVIQAELRCGGFTKPLCKRLSAVAPDGVAAEVTEFSDALPDRSEDSLKY